MPDLVADTVGSPKVLLRGKVGGEKRETIRELIEVN